MNPQELRTVVALALFVSAGTVGWLLYQRFFTCLMKHHWKVEHVFKVSDYRDHFVGWRGERRCKLCGKYEAVTTPVASIRDLAR